MNCIICNKEIEKSRYSNAILCSSECFKIDFWNEKVQIKDNPRIARINSEHYYIKDENPSSYFKGHSGRQFKIKFFDGREFITTNLWYNGKIPDEFKEKLPDNAEFIYGER